MKTKPLMNFGDSVRARLLAIAKSENIQLEYLLLRYALERFLCGRGSVAIGCELRRDRVIAPCRRFAIAFLRSGDQAEMVRFL